MNLPDETNLDDLPKPGIWTIPNAPVDISPPPEISGYFNKTWPDYGAEVPEPRPTFKTEYIETVDEWSARCRAMLQQEGQNL